MEKETPTAEDGAGTPPLHFDAEEYRRYVEDYDLSEAQQQELLETLWSIIVQFVDLGFGIHPIQ